jgi:hypothetical protein
MIVPEGGPWESSVREVLRSVSLTECTRNGWKTPLQAFLVFEPLLKWTSTAEPIGYSSWVMFRSE